MHALSRSQMAMEEMDWAVCHLLLIEAYQQIIRSDLPFCRWVDCEWTGGQAQGLALFNAEEMVWCAEVQKWREKGKGWSLTSCFMCLQSPVQGLTLFWAQKKGGDSP